VWEESCGSRPTLTDAEFEDFVSVSWASLYRTAYLLVGSRAEAEDLVQTALANTYASWHRVRELPAAHAYARTAVVRSAASWHRSRFRRREHLTSDVPETAYGSWDDSSRPMLLDALRRLPPRQRAVVVLRFYEDLSIAETARALGCSDGNVKSQTHVALRSLRLALGDAMLPSGEGPLS
jgi:RNA polymerase sigma-70 factor (sigma-E family)